MHSVTDHAVIIMQNKKKIIEYPCRGVDNFFDIGGGHLHMHINLRYFVCILGAKIFQRI